MLKDQVLCTQCGFTPKSKYSPISPEDFWTYGVPPTGYKLEEFLRSVKEEEEDLVGYKPQISRLKTILRNFEKD
ncbi:hypothetical protein PM082_002108 [Marasmius tenuissimus]|nr:hypothetical protein PM082_002108 [Marasmius tenuissimus]